MLSLLGSARGASTCWRANVWRTPRNSSSNAASFGLFSTGWIARMPSVAARSMEVKPDFRSKHQLPISSFASQPGFSRLNPRRGITTGRREVSRKRQLQTMQPYSSYNQQPYAKFLHLLLALGHTHSHPFKGDVLENGEALFLRDTQHRTSEKCCSTEVPRAVKSCQELPRASRS